MIKELLRKYLNERVLLESTPMAHFKERVQEVLYDIQEIEIPSTSYISTIPKETQDEYIIKEIQKHIQKKIDEIIAKNYPVGGVCVLVPLGIIKIQPVTGNPSNIMITAKRDRDLKKGFNYYITVYDNRLPTLVLADPNNPNNATINTQLQAHIKNTIDGGYPVNREKSFIDKSFMGNILIPIKGVSA